MRRLLLVFIAIAVLVVAAAVWISWWSRPSMGNFRELLVQTERSLKYQPEFDLSLAQKVYSGTKYARNLSGETITSPHDLFSVEALRTQLDLRAGPAFPTDVFVFGKGEIDQRDCTKVGGTPYWPKGRRWPANEAGVPMQFLAQFNFADSKDLFSDLPGDVLLLFVPPGGAWQWKDIEMHFEWFPLGLDAADSVDSSLIATDAGPFYGSVYRTADFPDAFKTANVTKDNSDRYFLDVLNATKIGGLPYSIQGHAESDGFLCQLNSIQAAPRCPFPWVNHRSALTLSGYKNSIYSDENEFMIGDLGNIYIFRGEDGQLKNMMECY